MEEGVSGATPKRCGLSARKSSAQAELKNMNSFKFVKDALEYEIERQIDVIESGGKVLQESRLFDRKGALPFPCAQKEEAHDYRYFPEPIKA